MTVSHPQLAPYIYQKEKERFQKNFTIRKGGQAAQRDDDDDDDVHVSTVITAAEVVLQLCAERRRERLVLVERRICAISGFTAPRPATELLEERFPERRECQMFRRLEF